MIQTVIYKYSISHFWRSLEG